MAKIDQETGPLSNVKMVSLFVRKKSQVKTWFSGIVTSWLRPVKKFEWVE